MPAFARFEEEGKTIGRLLTGYGELELNLCTLMIATTGDLDASVRAMFSRRGEEHRITEAKRSMKAAYTSAGLRHEFFETMTDMHQCRLIRNQYAHCVWYDTPSEGLAFCDLEAMALDPAPIIKIAAGRKFIDQGLLDLQEVYFAYVANCLWHLENAYRCWAAPGTNLIFSRPPKMDPPPRHN